MLFYINITFDVFHNNPQPNVVFAEPDLRSEIWFTTPQVSHLNNRHQFSMCHVHCPWFHVKFFLSVMLLSTPIYKLSYNFYNLSVS